MFADLVGFTPLSEVRDPEEVRDLLGRYFAACTAVVDRYGGVVEKFIGDAVMAVWGTPTAHEDDAERAVRAALDVVDAVAGLGAELAAPELAARAGVVTGPVAVSLGAVGQGMVAGDAVNTAARVQAAASPGTVYVDEATRAASAAAVGYAAAGEFTLKGKAAPVPLFAAERVLAGRGGAQRVDGLEAPFVGRDRELRLVKELFHAAAESSRARLLAVSGQAGVGKSRLGWEFFKYIDGLAGLVRWHAGRCLPYGDGVTYWALTEMVRMRFGIAETDPAPEAAAKLTAGLAEVVADESDRAWLTPRVAVLLGLTELAGDSAFAREELFGAWRLLFETLARAAPVVLVVEELQWADAALLDFLDHLLDWSRDHPIFVLTLARPELEDRRAGWGSGRRNATALFLDPLAEPAMQQVVDGLVTGLPGRVRDAIVARAEGLPLYAVETVRMLIDRDLVVPREGVYVLAPGAAETLGSTGLAELGVPATLVALIAARLDALPATERRLVADAAVLGVSFTGPALAALAAAAGLEPEAAAAGLAGLVRKEFFTLSADPRSPERGSYRFVQPLVRTVAYDTLSHRDRKARHLAVATRLAADWPGEAEEIAEVLADHYLAAYRAGPTDPDAGEIRAAAVVAFRRAGARAGGLGAPEGALAAYRAAAELAEGEDERAELLGLAGRAALEGGRHPEAVGLLERAIEVPARAGRDRQVARLTASLGRALQFSNRAAEAAAAMSQALACIDAGEVDEDVARLSAQLGSALLSWGHNAEAAPHIDAALAQAQALDLPDVLSLALMTHGLALSSADRYEEAVINLRAAAEVAERHGLTGEAMGARGNVGDLLMISDLTGGGEEAEAALGLARRHGDRDAEAWAISNIMLIDIFAGRWADAARLGAEALSEPDRPGAGYVHHRLGLLAALRGDGEAAARHVAALAGWEASEDVQAVALADALAAAVALGRGQPQAASARVRRALATAGTMGVRHEVMRQAWPDALEAALALGDLDEVERLLAIVADRPLGHVPPYLRAQHARYRARLDAARGEHDEVEAGFTTAEDILAELGYPYWLARTRLDHARWLAGRGQPDRAAELADQAAVVFDQLGAATALAEARDPATAVSPS